MASCVPLTSWSFDPEDPRAPSPDQWEAMSPDERRRVVAMLPADPIPLRAMGESDTHYDAVDEARKGLRRLFEERKRSVYVGTNMAVYYPAETVFTPDLFAVVDVPTHPRSTWVVQTEQRGLDVVIEVCVAGDRRKDTVGNVAKYARLGIREYFVLEPERRALQEHRLEGGSAQYMALAPHRGRFASQVLELELAVDQGSGRLRFFTLDGAQVPFQQELVENLERAVDGEIQRAAELERVLEEERRGREEAERLLAEARAEIARLRGGPLESKPHRSG